MTTECAVLAGGCYWGMQDFFADTTAFCQRASATQVRKRVPRCSDDSAAASVKAVLNETGRIDIPVNNASYESARGRRNVNQLNVLEALTAQKPLVKSGSQ